MSEVDGKSDHGRSRSPAPNENGNGKAGSRSPSPGRRSRSRSVERRSRSVSPRREQRSPRRSRSPRRRSRSPRRVSPRRRDHRRRSRSRTFSPPRRHHDRRSRSPRFRRRSPPGGRRFGGGRYGDGRENPDPCSCLGVFGMSINTNEKDLREIFGSYGEIESVQIVYDRNTGRSRGFGFVYFASTRDATRAKEALRDTNIDGARVRIDYSVTKCGGPDRRRRSRSRSPRRSRRSGSR